MKPTEQQDKAIKTLDADVCVTAGAGSGKTLVLALRYLHILRTGTVGVPGIVAITFTEKAAREMRDRIRAYCDREIRSARNNEELRKWRAHKRDLEGARISTIHGFCSGILREHPVEAGVDPVFSVKDENAATILAARVVDESVEDLLISRDGHIQKVIDIYGVRRTKGILRALLGRMEDTGIACNLLEKHDDNRRLLEMYRERLIETQAELARQLSARKDWRGQINFLKDNSAATEADKLEQERRKALDADRLMQFSVKDADVASALQNMLTINLRGGSAKYWRSKELLEKVKAAIDSLRESVKAHKDIVLAVIDEKDVENIDLARALKTVYYSALERYRRAKEEAGVLTFEDLEIKTRDLLSGNEDVRRELQGHIRFILVDEFQDISPIQHQIIWLLAGRTGADKGRGKRPNLFFVGDDKQSIYRFRGADVGVFTNARKGVNAQGRIALDTNFRTVEGGVELANVLFGELMHKDRATRDYHAVYEEISPFREALPEAPFAELLLLRYGKEEKPRADESRLCEARAVAQKILKLTSSDGMRVYDQEEKKWVRPGFRHIAVICRKLKYLVHAYERAFQEAEIPYHVTAGSDFYARQEVRDVLNMLRVIDNPRDEYALAGALRSPMFSMSDEALYWLSTLEGDSFTEKFHSGRVCGEMKREESEKLDFARRAIPRLQSLKDRFPLPQIIKKILEITGMEAILATTFNGSQKIANLRKMIEVARGFEAGGIFSLRDFIRYVDEFVTEEMRESQAAVEDEEENVVRIMTVHKAKGLEFPIVIIPDICPQSERRSDQADIGLSREMGLILKMPERSGNKPPNGIYKLHRFSEKLKDEAESKRLLYVAMTRAKDRLILSGCVEKGKEPQGWLGYLADALSLDMKDAGEEAEFLHVVEKNIYDPASAPPRPKGRTPDISTIIEIMQNVEAEEIPADTPQWRRVSDVPPSLETKRAFNPTELVEYAHCPRKYCYRFVRGYPEMPAQARQSSGVPGVILGTIAHRLFETLRPGDREEQIRQAIQASGEFTEAERNELAKTLRRFVEKFDASSLSKILAGARELWTEVSFVAKCGDALIEGKIDSLFRDSEGALHILDYKSDLVPDGKFDEKLNYYRLQLAAYALGAGAALGEVPKSARLYFFRYGGTAGLPVSEKDIQGFEKEITKVISDIRANRFDRRAPAPCRCGYEWLCKQGDNGHRPT